MDNQLNNSDSQRRKLEKAYSALPKVEQSIVRLSSILYEPVTKNRLLRYLQILDVRVDRRKPLTTAMLNPMLQKLVKRELIVYKDRIQCSKIFIEIATRLAAKRKDFEDTIHAARTLLPLSTSIVHSYPVSMDRCIRDIRLAIYSYKSSHVKKYYELGKKYFPREFNQLCLFTQICNNPFEPDWFRRIPLEIQASALSEIVYRSILRLDPIDQAVQLLKEYHKHSHEDHGDLFRVLLVTSLLACGQIEVAREYHKSLNPSYIALENQCGINFITGDYEEALRNYETALSLKKQETTQSHSSDLVRLFYVLCLLKKHGVSAIARIRGIIGSVGHKQFPFYNAYSALEALLLARENRISEARSILYSPLPPMQDSLSILFLSFVKFWVIPGEEHVKLTDLKHSFERAVANGYNWIAMEFAALLSELHQSDGEYKQYHERMKTMSGMVSMLGLIRHEERWERSLKALTLLGSAHCQEPSTTQASRLVWFVNLDGVRFLSPKIQIRKADGNWSKGRRILLKRLKACELDCMTPQDQRICSAIEAEFGARGKSEYYFNYQKAILEMVGHPLLFLENSPNTSVDLIKEEMELSVARKGKGFEIQISADVTKEGVFVYKETPTRYKVIHITKIHREIANIFGSNPLKVPLKGQALLAKAISSISSIITVHSAVGGQAAVEDEVTADSRCCFQLFPIGQGFKLELFVKPFTKTGPYFKPGAGRKHVIADVKGKRLHAQRNLPKERKNAYQVMKECPALSNLEQGNMVWMLNGTEECLEILLQLQELEDKVMVEWPEGEKLKVRAKLSFEDLSIRVDHDSDWFNISGELKVDDLRVMEMRMALDLLEASEGNFIPLGNNEFIALTDELRRQLLEINSFGSKTGEGFRLHSSAILAIQDFTEKVRELDTSPSWTKQIDHIARSAKYDPSLPSTLQAKLRDYQIEGFRWLARLAHWGVGACLADDMGLGKTIQALTLVLDRAEKGPTLVVAPASVCMNWTQEAARFAPILKLVTFNGKSRKKMLRQLKSFDLLVCSYGLLQNEGKHLAQVRWATIILDEAQAIKNKSTERSKTAMQLLGDFKMITTGTPIENHLGELWNLFQFINPGLLGTFAHFNKKFAIPIEKHQDNDTKKLLRKLIKPFILRRLKTNVLEELPPKTEIILSVEMSTEEMELYEALRNRALEEFSTLDISSGKSRMKIFAEIMKLRRACCDPQLILKQKSVKSSKLELFAEVVQELLENRHKALVFSQFVDYLRIIRKTVENLQIPYQYLDGSTSRNQRQKRVEAFQAGHGDLFLISLKAGGVGLNLTAADYVIHMDPWWNPAVEDQASNRVHRIGQQHPVTIYKLITENTIEEKIVNLHREKRELAEGLLAGSDMSGKLSPEALIKLIRER